jgi:hypothetical protein
MVSITPSQIIAINVVNKNTLFKSYLAEKFQKHKAMILVAITIMIISQIMFYQTSLTYLTFSTLLTLFFIHNTGIHPVDCRFSGYTLFVACWLINFAFVSSDPVLVWDFN